jgi:hypothetical protein
LFSFGCYSEEISSSKIENSKSWQKYETKEYMLKYPGDWELVENPSIGAEFYIAPIGKKVDFSNNVNLLIQDLRGRLIDLDSFVVVSEKQIADLVSQSKIFESKRILDSKQEYHKIIYSGVMGNYHLKFLQYYYIKNEQAYVLTYTALEDKFKKDLNKAEDIFSSFSLK